MVRRKAEGFISGCSKQPQMHRMLREATAKSMSRRRGHDTRLEVNFNVDSVTCNFVPQTMRFSKVVYRGKLFHTDGLVGSPWICLKLLTS